MGKLSKTTIASMEANRDRMQAAFDGLPLMHSPDREFSGVTIPKAVLLWGGRDTKPFVLDPGAMKKTWQKASNHATFVFWDVDVGAGIMALGDMGLPGVCIGCGTSKGVTLRPPILNVVNTLPKSTSSYRLRGFPPGFGVEYCDACATHPMIDVAHQKDAEFLLVSFGAVRSAKAYQALVEANADHAIPHVEMVFSERLDNNDLVTALRNRG